MGILGVGRITFQCIVMHATWTALSGSFCVSRQVETFVNSASNSHSLVFQGEPVMMPWPEALTLSW
eukprot:1754423-Pleurochrysis_carterae.AAC.1